jgi:aminoglycoside 6'-N-acetyltransferase I
VIVRAARGSDLDEIAALRSRLWPESGVEEHRAEARAILAGEPRSTLPLVIFVAEEQDSLLGFVEVGLRSHADGCDPARPVGFIEGWFVAAEQRGRGIGRLLIARAEDWAREQGCRELASDTWLDNEASARAHAALGFEVVDRCVNFRKSLAPPRDEPRQSTELHYGADLARVHHDHFGMIARAAARELTTRLTSAGLTSGTVVDLAAGSGILSRALSEAGFTVFGADLSEDMLRIAREQAPRASFVGQSLWSVELPPCVAVAAIGEALSYAADPVAGLSALERRLSDIERALLPGGLVLFDVAGPGRSGPQGSRRAFWSLANAEIGLEEIESGDLLTRRITVFVPEGERCRRTQETHRLRLYAPEAVEALLTKAGFSWERLDRYADFTFPEGLYGFAATKRRT